MVFIDKIYNCDCIDGIAQLGDESVDLVVTSPPYNVDLGNNRYNKSKYDIYNDSMEYTEYMDWLRDVFQHIYKKLRRGGRVVINIGDGRNGAVPTHADLIHVMCHDIGYKPMTQIIWNKNQTSTRTAWGSFCSPSSPSFPRSFEYIMVFCKDSPKLQWRGETDLTKEEFVEFTKSIWNIAPEKAMKKIGHPAMFPEDLVYRVIKMFSWVGSTILDPFMGSGTTAVVCKKLNRHYIGFEISKNYCEIAEKRLENEK